MKARQRRRELVNEYLSSLFIAFLISIPFGTFFIRALPINRILFMFGGAFLYGTAFFLLGFVRNRIRLRSFVMNVMVSALLMSLVVFGCFFVMVWFIVASMNPGHAQTEVLANTWHFMFLQTQLTLLIVGFLVALLINFTFQISKKMGPGVLTNWITGKYYTPREEPLVFMFLDMKDSTTLAEQLGAIKFSALVRDFFYDMTGPLMETRGRVSHYIGDEAVIYWKPEDAIKEKGPLAFFKWFEDEIASRAPYYQATYGLVPGFKAGLHMGPVVATEVGEIKSEIVFHGDALNTTARIQSMCNELGHTLLCSRDLAAKMVLPHGAIMSALGQVHLKGKAEQIELVAIE